MLKPIIQKDQAGCGLACVATVAGVSYQQVKRVAGQLGIQVQDPQLWSETTYVRTPLTHFGVSTSSPTTPFTAWASLPSLAFLAIKWHTKK
ncbi:MAG: hypothetical protein OEZ05_01480 [Nitrospirota bacterium]|nr:hypothetical protein [Nitrospirota bacterium]MDH5585282.1 hypothetical protein [Nitrospirota bacterium]